MQLGSRWSSNAVFFHGLSMWFWVLGLNACIRAWTPCHDDMGHVQEDVKGTLSDLNKREELRMPWMRSLSFTNILNSFI